jgi:hypothetical protein
VWVSEFKTIFAFKTILWIFFMPFIIARAQSHLVQRKSGRGAGDI